MAWTNPRTWVSGETVTAALLNTHLRDNFKAIGDPWTSYTPTWTAATVNPTLGNGTLAGSFISVGKLIMFRVSLTFGGTTSVGTGIYRWELPATAGWPLHACVGQAVLRDTSANDNRARAARLSLNTPDRITLAENAAGGDVAAAVPFAWASGDTIMISGMYEAA